MGDIEEAMKQAKASIQIEGFEIKPEHTKIVKLILENKISEQEFDAAVKKMVFGDNRQNN